MTPNASSIVASNSGTDFDKGGYMSYWTHIVGVLHIDTFKETHDLKNVLEDALNAAPKITGSEQDANIFVNIPEGHNVWTSCDCASCEFKDTIRHYDDGFECDAPEHYSCPSGEYQTRAVITVQGDLRDRMRSQTKKEWNAFHRYIAKNLDCEIRIATCKIDGC